MNYLRFVTDEATCTQIINRLREMSGLDEPAALAASDPERLYTYLLMLLYAYNANRPAEHPIVGIEHDMPFANSVVEHMIYHDLPQGMSVSFAYYMGQPPFGRVLDVCSFTVS